MSDEMYKLKICRCGHTREKHVARKDHCKLCNCERFRK